MANEEIRGEQQDPRLIGISAVGGTPQASVVSGLGGQAGSVPGMPNLTPTPTPFIGGPQKVFDTLPINARRFYYDYIITGSDGDGVLPELGKRTVRLILLGPNAPYHSEIFTGTGIIGIGDDIGIQTYGNYINLVTGFSFKAYINGMPLSPLHLTSYATQLQVSGATLFEVSMNAAGTDNEVPLFIALNSTDTFAMSYTLDFGDPNLGADVKFALTLHVGLRGVLIPDSGLAKQLQVSL